MVRKYFIFGDKKIAGDIRKIYIIDSRLGLEEKKLYDSFKKF